MPGHTEHARPLRRIPRLVIITVAVALPAMAAALTPPIPGAVPLPDGAGLLLPVPAGNRMRVIAGYGPNAGSSLHRDTDACCKANDHYALDLEYADEAQGGLGMPIVAPLAGEVVRAGWATEGWANYGQRVILRHDLGDGAVYHTLYAHLNAIAPEVMEGASVQRGQILGELGRSCQGALSCGSFSSPHLHFAMHRDSEVGGSGTGGSYGGNAVVPEPFDGAEDLNPSDVILSTNVEMVVCGDGVCSEGETSETCIDDCPRCEPVPRAGRVIDESEVCFSRGGTEAYWQSESAGYGGGLLYTLATDAAEADNFGVWRIALLGPGRYRVEVHAPAPYAESRQAAYQIHHAGSTDVVRLDQRAVDGFTDLGVFDFAGDGDEWMRLDDNTGEPVSQRVQLVYDAVRLSRVDPPGPDAGPAPDAELLDASEVSKDGGPSSDPRDSGDDAELGCGCTTVSSGRRPHRSLLPPRIRTWIRSLL